MFFSSVLLKTHKGFLCVLKNIDQNNICASIVFKAKTKKIWNFFFYSFYFKTQKSPFLGVNHFFPIFFFQFNIIDTQMLFWSVFLKTHKKTVINCCKRKLHANFHKKMLIFGPRGNFLKMKTLMRFRWRTRKIWIWTSKIIPDIWLVDLFWPIKKNSTLHPTVYCSLLCCLLLVRSW